MNEQKLKDAEDRFLKRYPGGFAHPEMEAIARKHKMDAMIELCQSAFKKNAFKDEAAICDTMVKVVSRASMVSMFEKPKFRDFVAAASPVEHQALAAGLKALLHGSQKNGLQSLVDILKPAKLAKWSLVTIIPNYFRPSDEVFVKPTTAKGVIEFFELPGLTYKAEPSWEFYQAYREAIQEMKSRVDPLLAPSNAAFCGFLMMSLK